VGVVRLDRDSIFTADVVDRLRSLGLDIATYEDVETVADNHHL